MFFTIASAPVSYPAMVFWLSIALVPLFATEGRYLDLIWDKAVAALIGGCVAAGVAFTVAPIRLSRDFRPAVLQYLDALDAALDSQQPSQRDRRATTGAALDRAHSALDTMVASGIGKTHVAQALGHQVARRGGDVRFVKTSRVLSDLAGGYADRSWGQRIREYTKSLVLILDDFAMREDTAMHADDLYELISDRAVNGKPLVLTSNRAPKDWYGLFPNPVVAESLLDRLINTSHQILMDGPSYRPRKRPGVTK